MCKAGNGMDRTRKRKLVSKVGAPGFVVPAMLPRDIWMALAAPSLASFESSISLVHLLTPIFLALLSLRASPSMAWSPITSFRTFSIANA